MQSSGTIRGIIRDADDFPMEEVQVMIVSGPAHADISAITGADGTFDMGSLRPGRYIIKAYASQAQSEDVPVRVYARKAAFVEMWLDEGELDSPIDESSDVVDEM